MADIAQSLDAAARDFREAPRYGLAFGAIYTVFGLNPLAHGLLGHATWHLYRRALGRPDQGVRRVARDN